MSMGVAGFRKNRPEEEVVEVVEESTSILRSPAFIAICALIGGTIILTAGVAVQFGLASAAIVLGLILIVFGFVLGKDV